MKRRSFIENSTKLVIALSLLGIYACKQDAKQKKENETKAVVNTASANPFFELSLAQWSINKMIREGGVDPYTFAAKKHGLKNLLIMIDGEGPLASENLAERISAVENHYKWVDAAAAMGCHSIRVNLQGSMEYKEWVAASVDGLTRLAKYSKTKSINIIVENHGGPSSNASWLSEVMNIVDMENCGTLPDFGNFCVKRKDGSYYGSECLEEYDKYQGVKELMSHAKAVSAKAYDFDESGNETKIDFVKMMQIVKQAGYTEFVGVEYEGDVLSEEEGIIATKNLLLKVASQIK